MSILIQNISNEFKIIKSILIYTRLPGTSWVKLSLNFELLVKGVMKFLVGQRLFNNNISCTTWIIPHPRNNQEN